MDWNLKILNLLGTTLLFFTQVYTVPFGQSLNSNTIAFPNGGFETNPINPSNGWTWPANDWVWDGSVAHNGTHSARVNRVSGGSTASLWSDYMSVNPTTNYNLTYWLRTQNATLWPSVIIYQYTSGHIQTGPGLIAHANISNGSSSWNQVNYRFQTMPDAYSIRIRIYIWTGASGVFWFDDIYLDPGANGLYPFHSGFPVVASGSVLFSSPVVADINNDGANELLIAGGSYVNGWDRNGALLPGFPLNTGDLRIMGQLALGDLDSDGDLEIVAGTRTSIPGGQGRVFVWHHNGILANGWPKSVAWDPQYSNNDSWVSSVALADIDGDHALEILASTTNNATTLPGDGENPPPIPNLYAWHADGSLVTGNWPNWHTVAGFYGTIAAGDLNGDGIADVIAGRDHHYLNAYSSAGISITGWPIQTFLNSNSGNYQTDYRVVHGSSAPILADLDGDGKTECIVVGFEDGPGNSVVILNSALLVFEPDGKRRVGWESAALGNGILDNHDPSFLTPAVADLDNDGQLEIIVTTFDGWIRAYKENKTVLWAYNYAQGTSLSPTEPVIGDINGDGRLEILFGTFVTSLSDLHYNGPVGLWALKADGTVMPGFPLPVPTPGIRGAPTLADLDGDGKLEIMAASREGEVFVWDTLTTYDPSQLPWPTGRHDLRRSGTYTDLKPLRASYNAVSPGFVNYGDIATFSIHIVSNSPSVGAISLSNTIPSGLSYIPGTLSATSGIAVESGSVINWSGSIPISLKVGITYKVAVITTTPVVLKNTVVFSTTGSGPLQRTVDLFANFSKVYLPSVRK
jgi:uncharacterized repeat protein (TIGR01451 family)